MTVDDFLSLLAQLSDTNLSAPESYSDKVSESRSILGNDITGFVSPLIKLAIIAAEKVKYTIETDNDVLDEKLNNTLKNINSAYVGKINIGLNAIKKDFIRSHWESGMSVVKTIWNDVDGMLLPQKMFLLDSESIEITGDEGTFANLEYKMNDKVIRDNDSNHLFIYKDCPMYQKYPDPPLIANGIYTNYHIKKSIKSLQNKYLSQVVAILWFLLKGDKTRPDLKYNGTDFADIKEGLQEIIKNAKDSTELENKIPLFVGRFDTRNEIITPELEKMMTHNAMQSIDIDILAGMGFISVLEGISTRRDITLNPKPFISSVVDTTLAFKKFLNDLVFVIAQKNAKHIKYFANLKYRIVASPLTTFWGDDMKNIMKLLSDRGLLSIEDSLEFFDVDFESQLNKREKEVEDGTETVFYPRPLLNQESNTPEQEILHYKGIITPSQPKKTPKETTEDKTNPVDKLEYKFSTKVLELIEHFAPYKTWGSIPAKLKKTLRTIKSSELKKAWLDAFNHSWMYYKEINPNSADIIAARTAWKMVKLMGIKTKKGWIVKKKYKK